MWKKILACMLRVQKKPTFFDPLVAFEHPPPFLPFPVHHTAYTASNFYCHCVPTVVLIRLSQAPTETVTMINIVVIRQLPLQPLSMAL